jgi:hypothetical protein
MEMKTKIKRIISQAGSHIRAGLLSLIIDPRASGVPVQALCLVIAIILVGSAASCVVFCSAFLFFCFKDDNEIKIQEN